MRKLFIIGIGAGHRDHITVQAVEALNKVDVFFALDKGREKEDLARLRQEICETHIKGRSYRTVSAPDPERDRKPSSYESAVKDWHQRRVAIFERMIAQELGEDECGAFLVWGDPALYDSTLRIVQQILARGAVQFAYEVIPGVSSVQALAAAHKISLNQIGTAVEITTGRNVAAGFPDGFDNVVVMLDADCAFKAVKDADVDIYWGAYIGTKDEILVSGDVRAVAAEIERIRAEARARKGWIMDIYLLRKRE
ncbi:precorrin-6A synthase (deacetylating) [Methylocapsa sp. S129]|uniref:precorrin-6A synthase (deacetylating) n=1 Tax=Methylocapsa sp. S129 TaxID=1641869 RepID=UPI00131B426C|nr:precorrin-6A synthase (deacetylating) [Methylocapsa sp. S129]